ncbi:MAG TPA: CHAT domain-containing tetratricopeptide repeat protein [Thermoanaerobaculia bacterium]|nr:CHAT domain-containing tetratricopeptide repeat protein [Thermoanaerobaculia bacterium]
MAKHKRLYSVLLMTITLAAGSAWAADSALAEGVIVETIGKGSALERAGVQLGDTLLSWKQKIGQDEEIGTLHSPFDWIWLEIERAPRGKLQLFGKRNGHPISFLVDKGTFETEVRPNLQEPFYLFGARLIDSGEILDGAFLWERYLQELNGKAQSLAAWLHLRLATTWINRSDSQQAEDHYRLALINAPSSSIEIIIHLLVGNAYMEQEKFTHAEVRYCSALNSGNLAQVGGLGIAKIERALGRAAWSQGHLARAEYYWSNAFATQSILAPESLTIAESHINLSNLSWARGDLHTAEKHLRRSISLLEIIAPESLILAISLNRLGEIIDEIGDYDEAKSLYLRSLHIKKALDPESSEVAVSLNSLGNLASTIDLKLAETYYRAAIDIQLKTAPSGLIIAALYANLAGTLSDGGDIRTAQTYYDMAFQIQERISPDSLDLATTIKNQANLYINLGDIETGEALLRKALLIQERSAPNSLFVANTLSQLGGVAADRADFDAASAYYMRALEIQEKLAPESFDVAITLSSTGDLAWARGDTKSAEKYRLRALAILRGRNREDPYTAVLLNNLGNMAWAQGKTKEALEYLNEALEIGTRLAPDSIDVAWTLQNLGYVARDSGDVRRAIDHLERALRIKEKLMPKSGAEAEVLHALGLIYRTQKNPQLALNFFLRTLDAIESQVGKLGGTHDAKSNFRAQNHEYYRDAIQQLVESGQAEKAFKVQESARARGFIAMLAERDIILDQDLPVELRGKRQQLNVQYDHAQQELLTVSAQEDNALIERLLIRLGDLRREIDETDITIRDLSPKLAALHYPETIEADEAAAFLDPGTLMLSYSVGRDRTYLFVVSRGRQMELHVLDVGEDELRRAVALFSSLIRHSSPVSESGKVRSDRLETLAMDLFRRLLEPASEAAEGSKRLLIVPDGPLHVLPWGALIRRFEGTGRERTEKFQYLAEWKALHTAVSVTAYFEARKFNALSRPDIEGSTLLVAFGDPVVPMNIAAGDPNALSDVRVRSLSERGFKFEPLPATRREVDEISRLYPQRSLVYLGREATEENAKSIPRDVRIVHFATHGVIDERFPFNSAVVLSIPEKFEDGRENGLLQAWEVFERVRLNADLVVLSACDSGLGKEMGGEGLIGLTRAFQYAGARSVMASLWKISDRTTAEFMVRFYRHLKEGLSKDEALRATQMEFIRGPIQVTNDKGERVEFDASAPYYWAAFQIYGDWQ